ncbi:hypothetical protein [Burkholderia sp. Ac-20365]|uniref:hypothetical protein n=1 Tax=Burkholderia sp. Ac-20365 TaxID=2703897 RepID=UPI00197C7955|nr:hypothetical protein [Burkholderia sp. Ac-20365]MBN3760868.1 hypothetical protein [Burkholderia sp. Ac-20365]
MYELRAELETVNLKIALIHANARKKAISEIQQKMREMGLTTTALRKRLEDDPFGPGPRH